MNSLLIHHAGRRVSGITLRDMRELSPTRALPATSSATATRGISAKFTASSTISPATTVSTRNKTTIVHMPRVRMRNLLFLLTRSSASPGKLRTASPSKGFARHTANHRPRSVALTKSPAASSAKHRKAPAYLKGGIDTRNPAFNADCATRTSLHPLRRTHPAHTGATGVGKSRLAKRIYASKNNAGKLAANWWKSIAPPCAATTPCPRCLGM